MKSILFYWGKGADVRREIIRLIYEYNKKNKACFLNAIAKELGLSHVAVKRHIDLLINEGYVKHLNPKGKPVYLKLTQSGENVIKEFRRT